MSTPTEVLEQIQQQMGDLPDRLAAVLSQHPAGQEEGGSGAAPPGGLPGPENRGLPGAVTPGQDRALLLATERLATILDQLDLSRPAPTTTPVAGGPRGEAPGSGQPPGSPSFPHLPTPALPSAIPAPLPAPGQWPQAMPFPPIPTASRGIPAAFPELPERPPPQEIQYPPVQATPVPMPAGGGPSLPATPGQALAPAPPSPTLPGELRTTPTGRPQLPSFPAPAPALASVPAVQPGALPGAAPPPAAIPLPAPPAAIPAAIPLPPPQTGLPTPSGIFPGGQREGAGIGQGDGGAAGGGSEIVSVLREILRAVEGLARGGVSPGAGGSAGFQAPQQVRLQGGGVSSLDDLESFSQASPSVDESSLGGLRGASDRRGFGSLFGSGSKTEFLETGEK
jgi:hypothetical protein